MVDFYQVDLYFENRRLCFVILKGIGKFHECVADFPKFPILSGKTDIYYLLPRYPGSNCHFSSHFSLALTLHGQLQIIFLVSGPWPLGVLFYFLSNCLNFISFLAYSSMHSFSLLRILSPESILRTTLRIILQKYWCECITLPIENPLFRK